LPSAIAIAIGQEPSAISLFAGESAAQVAFCNQKGYFGVNLHLFLRYFF
jgi:hypothetical protein